MHISSPTKTMLVRLTCLTHFSIIRASISPPGTHLDVMKGDKLIEVSTLILNGVVFLINLLCI